MPKLLIVDDEANMLYSLKKGLQCDSLQVVTAETARLGMDAIKRGSPDAVLLDVQLPDKSGLELFREIREFDSRLPVIIMTAYSTTDLAIDATSRGAFDYLPKPVELLSCER